MDAWLTVPDLDADTMGPEGPDVDWPDLFDEEGQKLHGPAELLWSTGLGAVDWSVCASLDVD